MQFKTKITFYFKLFNNCEVNLNFDILHNMKTKSDLLNKLVSVIQSDPLTQFPVSKPHKKSTLKWIVEVFCSDSDSIPVPREISNILSELESALPEPEFIFKTFDRGSSVFVTLLEENRDIIGHGTTGLTSWQGALFLSDWAQCNVNKLKVNRKSILDEPLTYNHKVDTSTKSLHFCKFDYYFYLLQL